MALPEWIILAVKRCTGGEEGVGKQRRTSWVAPHPPPHTTSTVLILNIIIIPITVSPSVSSSGSLIVLPPAPPLDQTQEHILVNLHGRGSSTGSGSLLRLEYLNPFQWHLLRVHRLRNKDQVGEVTAAPRGTCMYSGDGGNSCPGM
ncbi:hypothetical protein Tco_0323271 [Tanacetum coccineum]